MNDQSTDLNYITPKKMFSMKIKHFLASECKCVKQSKQIKQNPKHIILTLIIKTFS